ncbi:flagellar hook-length control protein FliK [Neobacillus drentensis]|uniref:flagellar hook-length control protein FliK n=1 Tax=Neobacillus drentensis TaxID=220684 RepID=UPI00286D1B93|nr:flagellar hook-length control protein FliK [Neobacillus drentensis]
MQIPIKINQIKQSDGDRSIANSPTKELDNSFDQILAMFCFSDKSNKTDTEFESFSLPNNDDQKDKDMSEQINFTPDFWLELDNYLTNLLMGIQNAPTETKDSLSRDSQIPDESITASSIMEPIEAGKSLVHWLQKVEGFNQLSTMEPNQLIEGMTHLLSRLQQQEKQNMLDVPEDIKDKIQKIIEKISTGTNFDNTQWSNSQLHKNEKLIDDQKSIESKPLLSLDKNQAIFSSVLGQKTGIYIGNGFNRNLVTKQFENIPNYNGLTPLGNYQLQGSDDLISPNTIAEPPLLPVSEFAPEVSEWISRFVRITNGQAGGTEAKFSLFPEHLGHIEVKITSQEGIVSAQISTDTSMAKELLEGQLHQLKQALQQQGLVVQKVDIVQQSPLSSEPNSENLPFSNGGYSSSQEQEKRAFHSEQVLSKRLSESDQEEMEIETVSKTYGGATPMTTPSIDFTA